MARGTWLPLSRALPLPMLKSGRKKSMGLLLFLVWSRICFRPVMRREGLFKTPR